MAASYNLFSRGQLVPSEKYKQKYSEINWKSSPQENQTSLPVQLVPKPWGSECIFANNELYCGKQITVSDQWSSKGLYHSHPKKDETFFVTNGELLLDVEGKKMVLYPGDTYRIRPFTPHRFKAVGLSCTFLEVSTTHDDGDVIRGTLEALRVHKWRAIKAKG